jgi:hypothetical protein
LVVKKKQREKVDGRESSAENEFIIREGDEQRVRDVTAPPLQNLQSGGGVLPV